MYIIDLKAGSAGDEGAGAVCAFDCASVALNTVGLSVQIKPSERGDHLEMREKVSYIYV